MSRFLQTILKIKLFGQWSKKIRTKQQLNQIKESTKSFLEASERAKETLNNVYWQLLLFSSSKNDEVWTQRNIDERRISFNPRGI
jgi:hypothetical protein